MGGFNFNIPSQYCIEFVTLCVVTNACRYHSFQLTEINSIVDNNRPTNTKREVELQEHHNSTNVWRRQVDFRDIKSDLAM